MKRVVVDSGGQNIAVDTGAGINRQSTALDETAVLASVSGLTDRGELTKASGVLDGLLPTLQDTDSMLLPALQQAAKVAKLRLRHNEAYKYHRRVLELSGRQGATPFKLLGAYVEMATSLYHDGQYDESLRVARAANATLAEALPVEAAALLARLQAHVFECQGDYASAVNKRAEGKRLFPQGAETADELVRERLLLLRWRSALEREAVAEGQVNGARLLPSASTSVSAQLRLQLEASEGKVVSQLERVGKWELVPEQTPHHLIRGLSSSPWPRMSEFPAVRLAAAAMRKAHVALQGEYYALYSAGHLASLKYLEHTPPRGSTPSCPTVASSGCDLPRWAPPLGR
jgi:tetratricopeptide (TPR) repeat protein